jgi:hypothetical protein
MAAKGHEHAFGALYGSIAPITVIRPVRPGALLDPRRMGAAVA